jgi:hypothetical protein
MFIRKEISCLNSKFIRYTLSLFRKWDNLGKYGVMRNKLWRGAGLCAYFDDSKPHFLNTYRCCVYIATLVFSSSMVITK